MKQPLRIAAYVLCTIQILVAVFVVSRAYNMRDVIAGVLLTVPAAIAMSAMYGGPDREERSLRTQVTKARLRKELQDLEGTKS